MLQEFRCINFSQNRTTLQRSSGEGLNKREDIANELWCVALQIRRVALRVLEKLRLEDLLNLFRFVICEPKELLEEFPGIKGNFSVSKH